jgi:asparagine synthase (glutamine-hydrolysing)
MCGIAGIYNLNGAPTNDQEIKKMKEAIAHRGMDGDGEYLSKNVALGHRRLSILDTSNKAAQPMMSKDKVWVIVFNGCIYNFHQLKLELQSRGHTFNSNGDTEVIVEGLSAEGVDFFKRLDGMFAIGAYNTQTNELWISRDRFGVKPLYYTFNNGVFLFASEIKAFLTHKSYSIDLDFNSLNEYFTFQNMFTFKTLFRNVYMLPPANTVKIDRATTEIINQPWWDYNFTDVDETMSFEDAKEETKRLFVNAVSKQMVSDVPVGSYLSGGMDSGSITSIASKYVNRLCTFTCGFDMSEATGIEANYDERRDAELMANYFKTEHYEQVMNAGDIKWSLPRLVWHLEDLRVGMSYPNYYISRLASKFVKVCLQGTGGDELYGGYPWRYYRIFQSTNKENYFNEYYNFWQRLVQDENKSLLFVPKVYNKIDIAEPRAIFEKVFNHNSNLKYDAPDQHIANSLYFEAKTFLPGLLLVGDKLAMAHGLEERFPFLDNDLVNFAQKIPIRHKLGNFEKMNKINENELAAKKKQYAEYNDGKNVLRKAMTDFIPEKILNRKKQGFSAPEESWYRGENAAYVKDILLNKKTISSEFISQDYINTIVNDHIEKGQNNRLLIWSFLNFEYWCKIFLNNEKF